MAMLILAKSLQGRLVFRYAPFPGLRSKETEIPNGAGPMQSRFMAPPKSGILIAAVRTLNPAEHVLMIDHGRPNLFVQQRCGPLRSPRLEAENQPSGSAIPV